MACLQRGIRALLSRQYSCNIYYARNMCLGGDVRRGRHQKPFAGGVKYSYIMWIDSDIIFSPNDFFALLTHDVGIVSGIYLMDGGQEYATVIDWDKKHFEANGTFKFLTPDTLPATPIAVSYTGMGFMLVKYGVFEALSYPWFVPLMQRIGDIRDFTMEDVSFCLRAKKAGYDTIIDPAVQVGHRKSRIYK
jgi:GT2 family glycosyltransferase